MGLVLNPGVRDKYVWPIYCLANRLHGDGADALEAAGFPTRRNGTEHQLFATVPRIQAEQELVDFLAGGNNERYSETATQLMALVGAQQTEFQRLAAFVRYVRVVLHSFLFCFL